jgi:hypothetical protein
MQNLQIVAVHESHSNSIRYLNNLRFLKACPIYWSIKGGLIIVADLTLRLAS